MGKFKTNRKKNNKKLIIGACISLVLIVAIIISIMYKYSEVHERPDTTKEKISQPIESEKQLETPKQPEITEIEQPKTDEKLTNGYIDGQASATEPTFINGVLIVNKKNPLPATYNKGEDSSGTCCF